MREASVTAALLALWCGAGEAVAQTATPAAERTIAWEAPASCPGRDAFVRAVDRAAGRPLAGSPALDLAVTVTRGASGWTAQIRGADAEHPFERTLRAATCARLAESAATVIAVALDYASSSSVSVTAPAVAPAVEPAPPAPVTAVAVETPPPPPPPSPPPPAAPRPVAPPAIGHTLLIGSWIDVGVAPSLDPGLSLGYRLQRRWGFIAFEGGFQYTTAPSNAGAGAATDPTSRVDFALVRAGVQGGLIGAYGRLSLRASVGIDATLIHGWHLQSADHTQDEVVTTATLGAGVGVRLGTRFTLSYRIDLGLAFTRAVFDDNGGAVHHSAVTSVRSTLALEYALR